MRRLSSLDWEILFPTFAHLKLLNSNTVVCEHDQLVTVDVLHSLELGGQEQAGGPQELELVGGDPDKILLRTENYFDDCLAYLQTARNLSRKLTAKVKTSGVS